MHQIKSPKNQYNVYHPKAEEFLKIASQFKLGELPTEQRHPKTIDLAGLSKRSPEKALDILHNIDLDVIKTVANFSDHIEQLASEISNTFSTGGRVYIYGCGATGRLALSIEYAWRFCHEKTKKDANLVHGFMSGGDLALVHSIENFEDHPEFGAKQVREIGFKKNDLFIACTEGGETPSVIGATEQAIKISKRKPWFIYCNPDSALVNLVERSRKIIENPNINKVSLFVGNMSLSGSTRLQATTALQLFTGIALFKNAKNKYKQISIQDLIRFVESNSYKWLTEYVKAESEVYKNGEFVLYQTDVFAMSVVTDTTERSPTFSLPGFENQKEKITRPALAYVNIPSQKTAKAAWNKILLRTPIPLEWKILKGVAGKNRLYGFDFSAKLLRLRNKACGKGKQNLFKIIKLKKNLIFSFLNLRNEIETKNIHPFFEQILVKLYLNAHSTLVMGRLGRFESNVMTWVKPSNNKLIDRSIRYIQFLLEHKGSVKHNYDEVAHFLFREIDQLQPGESVVLKTVKAIQESNHLGYDGSSNLGRYQKKESGLQC